MKRMLFNATHAEELRVAIVDGQKLIDLDIETAGREQRKSNIYKGIITRIEPSLEACFVNYGEERHGFLPFKEISKIYFKPGVDVSKARIQDALSEGQELLVQIEKEERGNKGAALTTFVSLAGRYLVLMPNNPRGGGVSRRIEGEDRQELRETMDKLEYPGGMSIIARTAGIGRSTEELQWDLNYLLQLWRAIFDASTSAPGAFLIYQESSLVIRAIRDYLQPDIGEILIDTDDIYEQARQFMAHVMPDSVHRVKRYSDDVPLFSRFQIEHQIETAYSRTVPLPSGGAIVIDHTEALVAVDVNSARATRGSDIEDTACRTNLEAAEEVARQLRLRDLGGLIVIDFIDMESNKNQRDVEQRLKDALHHDRARVQMGKISRFGLMELSRQRLRPALNEASHTTCPRCTGTGVIRDTESSALHVLRIMQEEAMKENTAALHAQVPVDVATFLLNEKRSEIHQIEARLKVNIILIPNKHIETPHYSLERLRHDDERLESTHASYTMVGAPAEESIYKKREEQAAKPRQEAVVKSVTQGQPAPIVSPSSATKPASQGGFFARLLNLLGVGSDNKQPEPAKAERDSSHRRGRHGRNGRNGGRDQQNRRDRSEGSTPEKPSAAATDSRTEGRNEKRGGPRNRNENRGEAHGETRGEPRAENRGGRGERKPKEARPPKADLPLAEQHENIIPALEQNAPTHALVDSNTAGNQPPAPGAEGEERQGRSRRGRGRRNRGRNRTEGQSEERNEKGDNAEIVQEFTSPARVMDVSLNVPAAETGSNMASSTASSAPQEIHSETTSEASAPAPLLTQSAPPSMLASLPPASLSMPAVKPAIAPQEVEQRNLPQPPTSATTTVTSTTAAAAPFIVPIAESAKPVAPATTPVPAVIAPAPMPLDNLQAMLAQAGLELALTDAEKLTRARTLATQVVEPAHPPRERKPLPAASNEPLKQVETRPPV